tara:strand:- start:594 stop:1100 length:507 start_codon:yes stop_codon:yes gene_type:complete
MLRNLSNAFRRGFRHPSAMARSDLRPGVCDMQTSPVPRVGRTVECIKTIHGVSQTMDHQDWRTITFTKTKSQGDAMARILSNVSHCQSRDHKLERDEPLNSKKTDVEIRKAIQNARVAKGMTQRQLATALNVKVDDVVKLENGSVKTPTPTLVSKLKKVLGLTFKLHT